MQTQNIKHSGINDLELNALSIPAKVTGDKFTSKLEHKKDSTMPQ